MVRMRIHHIALRTTDTARLERFYAGVLGLRIVRRDDARGSVWLAAGEAVIMLERAAGGGGGADDGEPGIPAGTKELLAFAVDDLAPWRNRVDVEARTEHTLYFRDPDGRRVAVSAYRLTSPAR
jgi:catechol 2,3-dioxygenase-like lactoylglutathione lyase family enzyme